MGKRPCCLYSINQQFLCTLLYGTLIYPKLACIVSVLRTTRMTAGGGSLTPCCGQRGEFRPACVAQAGGCPTGSTGSHSAPRDSYSRRTSPSTPCYPACDQAYVLYRPSSAPTCLLLHAHSLSALLVRRECSTPPLSDTQSLSEKQTSACPIYKYICSLPFSLNADLFAVEFCLLT